MVHNLLFQFCRWLFVSTNQPREKHIVKAINTRHPLNVQLGNNNVSVELSEIFVALVLESFIAKDNSWLLFAQGHG